MKSRLSCVGIVFVLVVGSQTGAQAQSTSRIVFHSKMDRVLEDVWMANDDGTSLTNVTAIAHDPTDIYIDIEPKLCRNKIVFASNKGGAFDIWVIKLDGTGAANLTPGGAGLVGDREPDCTIPDPVELGGSGRVVFQSDMDRVEGEIYTVPLTGGLISRLTNNTVADTDPAWCGTNIVFTSERLSAPFSYLTEIYIMPAVGSSSPQALTCDDHIDAEPNCHPSGSQVAFQRRTNSFTCNPPCQADIYVKPTTCTTPCSPPGSNGCPDPELRLTFLNCADMEPDYSPGGGHITFSSSRAGALTPCEPTEQPPAAFDLWRMDAEFGESNPGALFRLTCIVPGGPGCGVEDASPGWAEAKP